MRRRAAGLVLGVGLMIGAAAAAGDDAAAFDAGMQALTGGDYAEAYCRWKPLAERGHAEAQYHLGWLYANGNGLAVSVDRALHWWRQAARQGHADAQFAVGLAYTTGEGIAKDLNQAVSWYLTAARQGHQDARDILIRLNGDPAVNLLEMHPELPQQSWFGWQAEIKGERINLRGGPGTDHKVVAQLEEGTRMRVIGERGEWYMVVLSGVDAGRVAWIHRTLVRPLPG